MCLLPDHACVQHHVSAAGHTCSKLQQILLTTLHRVPKPIFMPVITVSRSMCNNIKFICVQEKLALGPGVDPELVNLSFPIKHNLKWIARSLQKPIR